MKIKQFRQSKNLTQKDLGERLNVSDKTISSWETGRTYPDISMMILLSDIFDVSLDEFLKGDRQTVEKIDKDLKLKRVYKYLLLVLVIGIIAGVVFFKTYQYKNQWVDRFNPFLEMKQGYATLPEEVTYNGGKALNNDEKKDGKRVPQFPDSYKDIWVVDDAFGDAHPLTFSGGQAPDGKNYAIVQHKGLYVRRIAFISWESIPAVIRDNMMKEYEEFPNF